MVRSSTSDVAGNRRITTASQSKTLRACVMTLTCCLFLAACSTDNRPPDMTSSLTLGPGGSAMMGVQPAHIESLLIKAPQDGRLTIERFDRDGNCIETIQLGPNRYWQGSFDEEKANIWYLRLTRHDANGLGHVSYLVTDRSGIEQLTIDLADANLPPQMAPLATPVEPADMTQPAIPIDTPATQPAATDDTGEAQDAPVDIDLLGRFLDAGTMLPLHGNDGC